MNFLAASLSGDWRLPLDSFLGLLQRRDPDPGSPFGDALGWIIVFFVIVWPILRGILSTARNNRDEHEGKQAEAKPSTAKRASGRRTLEEILEGRLETLDSEDAPAPPPRPRVKVISRPASSASAPVRFGERPSDEGSAPVYGVDDLYKHDRVQELGKDPFDESAMERDLVPEERLRHVPTEDEIEAGMASGGTLARGTTQSTVSNSVSKPGASGRSAAMRPAEPLLVRDDPEVLFRRLPRPLSPWQKAFVMREVLGQPLSSRPEPTLTDLPD